MLSSKVPSYLADDIYLASESSARSLRSSSRRKCSVTRVHSRFGDRCFAAAGPRIWNNITYLPVCETRKSAAQNSENNWKHSRFRRTAAHRDFFDYFALHTYLLVVIKHTKQRFLFCRRFWHATHDSIVPYVDIILHRGQFWAKSAASGSVRWCCFKSCWTVLSHVRRGRPGWLLQSAGGEANSILLASALSSMRIICPNRVSRRDWIIAVSLGCFISFVHHHSIQIGTIWCQEWKILSSELFVFYSYSAE